MQHPNASQMAASGGSPDLELLIRSAADALGINLAAGAASAAPGDSPLHVLRGDLEYRLKELVNDAHKFMRHSRRKRLTAADINNALRMRNAEPLYGFGAPSVEPPAAVAEGKEGEQVYRVQDEEINLDDLINTPLPAVPLDVVYTAHWLAVEGVQPAIPQNPSPARPSEKAPEVPLVKHVLSRSLMVYHDKMTAALLGDDPTLKNEAFKHLASDTGITELAPYLVSMVGEKVTSGIGNLDLLWRMMKLVESLLDNPEIDLEPYIHQLMPTVLTCLVGKRLSPPEEDHWALRRHAAKLAARICRDYGGKYASLQPRTTKTLLRAFLDIQKPRPTHYGAVIGLGELGKEAVRLLVLPNLPVYAVGLRETLPDPAAPPSEGFDEAREEARKVFEAVVTVAGNVMKDDLDLPTAPQDVRQHLLDTYGDYFGEALYHMVRGQGNGLDSKGQNVDMMEH
ncbi:transcription initiation factor TFIID subunit 6 [Hyaloraphidium curvatum]|nr:transcription initiation factor TFIID subunit 6 [Hyaloraphidium curvatum]